MKETDIRKYAELMKELELTGLEITDDKRKVRLERSLSMQMSDFAYAAPKNRGPIISEADERENPDGKDYTSVKSDIVGVFYAAPAEDAAPYVSIGSKVKKGQTLCIVEAMKLMNEIIAEEDGVIAEICVTNGQVVEFGTELFRIRRA